MNICNTSYPAIYIMMNSCWIRVYKLVIDITRLLTGT